MAVRTVLTALSFVALAAPAMASSVIHSAPTELGYTTHPEHAEPGKSREQVLAEMDQSKKDGTWQYHRFGAPVPGLPALLRGLRPCLSLERVHRSRPFPHPDPRLPLAPVKSSLSGFDWQR